MQAPAFVDRTAQWGLQAENVQGNRLVAIDLDGDDWPDLVVHRGTPHRRADFTAEPRVWPYRILLNRPNPAGGRMFVDVTVASGYGTLRTPVANTGRAATFAVAVDVNNDGTVDLVSAAYVDANNPTTDPGDRSEVLLNDGLGQFTLAAPLPRSLQTVTPVAATTMLDYDRDGRVDLFVGNWYEHYGVSYLGVQDLLLLNAGGGAFLDGVAGSGLATSRNFGANAQHRPTYGVTACDVDGDGAMDLLTAAYGRQPNQLWLQRNFLFSDVGVAAGYAYDDNADFTDNQNYLCHCQISGQCTGQPAIVCPTSDPWESRTDEAAWRLGGNTFTTVCADMDNDGAMDLFNAEIAHWWAGSSSDKTGLLRQVAPQDGEPRFERIAAETSGIRVPHPTVDWNEGGLMAAVADFDGDGRKDVLAAFSDYPDQFGLLFHQQPDGTFAEVGAAAGLHHPCLSGMTLADLDRDGDLDVIAGSGTARDCSGQWPNGAEVHVYENTSGASASWIQLDLRGDGVTTNTMAVGARVSVEAGGVTQVYDVPASYGHAGMQNDHVITVGLASACRADVTVRWPDFGLTQQHLTGLAAGHRYRVVQGQEVQEVAP